MELRQRPLVLGLPMLDEAGRQAVSAFSDLLEVQDPLQVAELIADADVLHCYPPLGVDAHLLDAAHRLKLVAAAGSGVDHIDVAAAHARGIVVTHVVGPGALSVAEHTLGLMLALAKRLIEGDAHVRGGRFNRRHVETYHEISGRTLLIVGFGAVGRELARIACRGFGMKVLAATRDGRQVADPNVSCSLNLEEALSQADIVSVNVPLSDSTRGMIGTAQFACMKQGAWLIDTSRGGIVDAEAMAQALTEGRLGGAALDVFLPEPPTPECPLLSLPNVVLSPHNAGITREAYRRMSIAAARDIELTLLGQVPPGLLGSPKSFAASRAAIQCFQSPERLTA